MKNRPTNMNGHLHIYSPPTRYLKLLGASPYIKTRLVDDLHHMQVLPLCCYPCFSSLGTSVLESRGGIVISIHNLTVVPKGIKRKKEI